MCLVGSVRTLKLVLHHLAVATAGDALAPGAPEIEHGNTDGLTNAALQHVWSSFVHMVVPMLDGPLDQEKHDGGLGPQSPLTNGHWANAEGQEESSAEWVEGWKNGEGGDRDSELGHYSRPHSGLSERESRENRKNCGGLLPPPTEDCSDEDHGPIGGPGGFESGSDRSTASHMHDISAEPRRRLRGRSSPAPRPSSIIGHRQPLHRRPHSNHTETDIGASGFKKREPHMETRATLAPGGSQQLNKFPCRHSKQLQPQQATGKNSHVDKSWQQKEFVFPTLHTTTAITNGITPPKQQRRPFAKPNQRRGGAIGKMQLGALNVSLPPLQKK